MGIARLLRFYGAGIMDKKSRAVGPNVHPKTDGPR